MATAAEALAHGWQEHQAGRVREAERIYRQVIDLQPRDANAWCYLGIALHDQARFEEAFAAYERALAIQPQFAVALNNVANTLSSLGQFDQAVARCDQALRIKPDYANAYNNRGSALYRQGNWEAAVESLTQALRLRPDHAEALNNLGAAQLALGRLADAQASFDAAVRIRPDYAEARKNRAMVWLACGEWERGWPEYEWRWRCGDLKLPDFPQPLWTGEPLAGRTILLHSEQGLGDAIQFVRYARLVRERGGRVVAQCPPRLVNLLRSCAGIDQLVAAGDPLPPFDLHAPFMNVPRWHGTTVTNVPAERAYLRPPDDMLATWRARFPPVPEGKGASAGTSPRPFRVGIVWQGNPKFYGDRQRSIPLVRFAPLADVPGVELFSFQKGAGSEQLETLAGRFRVTDLGHEFVEFADTAAAMLCMDLIVTTDTSAAHLAGAIGAPVWMAVPFSPDWRWLREREDTPWYPTMRLFRPTRPHDWEGVFSRIAAALHEHVTGERPMDTPNPPSTPNPAPAATPVPAASPPADPAARRVLCTGFNAVVRGRHGYMVYNRHDVYIGRSVELYGEFSGGETEVFRQFLRPGDVAIEGGANIGAHTVYLSELVGPTGRIYAFEPQRIVFQTLCANLALNSRTNTFCRQEALGDAPGSLVVPPLNYDAENNFGGLSLGQFTQGETVPVVTLDSLGLTKCRLLKLDVEGMELVVLRGAERLLATCQPVLYFENDRTDKSPALLGHLLERGYRLFWHLPPMYAGDNFFGNVNNVFGRIVSVNVLGIPPSLRADIQGLRQIASATDDWRRA